MTRSHLPTLAIFCALALPLFACAKKEEEPAKKDDKPAAEAPPPPDPGPAEPRFDLSGPKPPQTSAVVFAVDGALLPLACFDQAKGALVAGSGCGDLVAEGSEVYMESSFGNKALEKTNPGKRDSMCGDKNALPTAGLEGGAAFDWAVFPKSLGPEFVQMNPDTWSDRGARLEEAETKATQAALMSIRNAKNDIQSKQKATVDIDGDGKDELFVSAVMLNPSDPESYLVSALLMAPGGDLEQVKVVDTAKRGSGDVIRLRGVVDLDGDGTRELWTGITFDGGNGDRIVQVVDGEAKPLGKWTCGA